MQSNAAISCDFRAFPTIEHREIAGRTRRMRRRIAAVAYRTPSVRDSLQETAIRDECEGDIPVGYVEAFLFLCKNNWRNCYDKIGDAFSHLLWFFTMSVVI
jgi:hypothetical protein